jgi:DNA adenine methylase
VGVFYRHRSRFNQLVREGGDQSSEAAQLFYYLNRTCFNGLCRFNSRGEYNVPFGKYKKINYTQDFSEYQSVFASWDFCATDFSSLEIKSGDLLYVDPPYDVEFTRYSEQDFKWEDQVRLVDWLTTLDQPMIVSNQATERVLELYRSAGFSISLLSAPRRIACSGDRTPASEMLAVRALSVETGAGELIKPISSKLSESGADLVTRSAGRSSYNCDYAHWRPCLHRQSCVVLQPVVVLQE